MASQAEDQDVAHDERVHDFLYLPRSFSLKCKPSSDAAYRAWRKSVFTLNTARRFRWAVDFKKREEEENLRREVQRRRFKVRVLFAKAAAAFAKEGERRRRTLEGQAPPCRRPTGTGFDVDGDELAGMMETENAKALKEHGGVEGLAEKLQTSLEDGVSASDNDLKLRREAFGPNTFPEKKGKSFLAFLFEASQDFTLIILMVCALVSLGVGISTEGLATGWYDGAGIIFSVLLVINVTAISDYQQSLQFLDLEKEKAKIYIQVTRDGNRSKVLNSKLVVGDVVHLGIGDQVPADGVFVTGHSLTIDESQMTGESEPVKKGSADPFLLSGCKVMDGDGVMLVLAVGMRTEWGRLMSTLSSDEMEETPLQVRLNGVATMVGKLGLTVAILVFVVLMGRFLYSKWGSLSDWTGLDTLRVVDFFAISVTIIVVAVPEGLPLAVTLTLAFAMHKMMAQNALVRHLSACETMGSATTICSDKTGTLTMNKMTVVRAWMAGTVHSDPAGAAKSLPQGMVDVILEGIATNTSGDVSRKEGSGGGVQIVGSPTETAILGFGVSIGMDFRDVRKSVKVVSMEPFNSAKKRMGCIVRGADGKCRVHWKGASEIVLGVCDRYLGKDGKAAPLTKDMVAELKHEIEKMAQASLRTITIAYRDGEGSQGEVAEGAKIPEEGLVCLGILGIKDPPRPGVPEAVKLCQSAGIVVRMVTGDNVTTARAIASEVNILAHGGEAVEGPKFRVLNEEQKIKLVPKLRVMARSSPTDKLLLVQHLQKQREVVAATGDGTNDAPALHQADIGLAMGIAGTEVAKESADIVILDDNFSTIVNVAKWGRSVYANIQKFVQFQLTVNTVALALNFVSAVLTGEAPLTAVQLLWVNLIMDTLGALALATDPPTDDLMTRPPVGRDAPLITNVMWRNVFGMAAYQLGVLFALQFDGYRLLGLPEDEGGKKVLLTVIFNSFVFCQVFNEINSRQVERLNVFSGVLRNKTFMLVITITVLFQAILVQFLGKIASTVPLNLHYWGLSVGLGALSIPYAVLVKLIPVGEAPLFHVKRFCEECLEHVQTATVSQPLLSNHS